MLYIQKTKAIGFKTKILKLEENSRTKLFCSAILFQLQNLEFGEKSLGSGVKIYGRLGNLNHTHFISWPYHTCIKPEGRIQKYING